MSIYNGFATRRKETTYLKCMYYMFVILQAKVASTYDGTPFDDARFEEKFVKLYRKIREMDHYKYLHPRFSMCFEELATTFGVLDRPSRYRERQRQQNLRDRDVRVSPARHANTSSLLVH